MSVILPTSLDLVRWPLRQNETLRAWDAADEYLLQQVSDTEGLATALVINDAFGALSLCIQCDSVTLWSDSKLAELALAHNQKANPQCYSVDFLSLTALPFQQLKQPIDLLVVKLPRSLSLLEWQLVQIAHLIGPQTKIMAAGMVKHMTLAQNQVFEKYLGKVQPSLAKKKARILHVTPDLELLTRTTNTEKPVGPQDKRWQAEPYSIQLNNRPGVFSRSKLDPGAQVILPHIPKEVTGKIVDLGCGNGVLGIQAAKLNPQAEIHFVDESSLAVASAEDGFKLNNLESSSANPVTFQQNNCLDGFDADSADLILCNPPFHQGHTVGDQIAWRMLSQAAKVLSPNGELLVVGNRHLGYHVTLKRLFHEVRQVAADPKFVVLAARKPRKRESKAKTKE